jgi:hypothetical protein
MYLGCDTINRINVFQTYFSKICIPLDRSVNFVNRRRSSGYTIFFCLFLRSNLGFDIAISSAKSVPHVF